jgi:HD superfamily phosphodiesterase
MGPEVTENRLREALSRRWEHVQGVSGRARKSCIACTLQLDREILIAAVLLHDIGYAPDIAHTGFHPLDGARYLQGLDAPRRLCALVAHHSCAYREAELRGLSAELAE